MARKYRATLFLAGLAMVSLVVHFWTGWNAFVADADEHGQTAVWWGQSGYLVEWLRQTFENLQSEFWQLTVQMALVAGILERVGVPAYEQDMEEIKRRLSLIEDELIGLGFGERGKEVR